MIVALARIKGAAAAVNAELGVLAADMAACDPRLRPAAVGDAASYDDQFPVDVFQTGSGTSSNMNANEVIATLASQRLAAAGPPERPRQRVAVVQRRVPVGDPHGRDAPIRWSLLASALGTSPMRWRPRRPSSPRSSRAAGRT